jgi:hydrogenase/urease accessory protein HupE
MKRLTALLFTLPSVAMAHPGNHSDLGLRHLLTQPDHLAMLAAGIVVAIVVVYKLRSRS